MFLVKVKNMTGNNTHTSWRVVVCIQFIEQKSKIENVVDNLCITKKVKSYILRRTNVQPQYTKMPVDMWIKSVHNL